MWCGSAEGNSAVDDGMGEVNVFRLLVAGNEGFVRREVVSCED